MASAREAIAPTSKNSTHPNKNKRSSIGADSGDRERSGQEGTAIGPRSLPDGKSLTPGSDSEKNRVRTEVRLVDLGREFGYFLSFVEKSLDDRRSFAK